MRLSKVAPLTAFLSWVFAVGNIGIAVALAFFSGKVVPLPVANVLTSQGWGIVFAVLGLSGIYFLLTNRNELVRKTQLVGVFVKSVWAVALVIAFIVNTRSLGVLVIWLIITFLQIGLYIHFYPLPFSEARHGAK